MELYGLNNIVKCGSNIYFIDIVGERLHLRNDRSQGLFGVTIDVDEKDLIEDIEMSDWLLDNIFKRHYYNEREFYWVVDSVVAYEIKVPYFKIEQGGERGDDKCGYTFITGNNFIYLDSVRELQNAYHFYSDYHEGDFLNEDIDEKIKKLFKLI